MPLTCVWSGMFNKVPTSLSCKNCQGHSALPGYLFSRNLQKLSSCLGKAPLGDLCSMWLTLPMDSEEILWGERGGKSWGEDRWAHTQRLADCIDVFFRRSWKGAITATQGFSWAFLKARNSGQHRPTCLRAGRNDGSFFLTWRWIILRFI